MNRPSLLTLKGCSILIALLLVASPSLARPAEPDSTRQRKQVVAYPVSSQAPRIDGRLDEAIWREAVFVSDFVQKEPTEGAAPEVRTEVAVLYDARAIYIGARMHSRRREDVRATVTRRDAEGDAERLVVSLDTYHDRRTAYSFAVTAAGVRIDYYHPTDSQTSRDFSYDPVWDVETHIDHEGWTAEFRIPFSQLRFIEQADQVWGINFNRWMPVRNEDVYWALVPKDETGWASRFGTLTGIKDIKSTRRVEVTPYLATGATLTGDPHPANPFNDGRQVRPRVGGEVKMGLGPSLTLETTINPDFGQVEADPAVVNLSAFESFFPERRPFFTEGRQLFSSNGPQYFYSRRIGARPRGAAAGDFVDRPNNTTILGAAKLAGRLPSGLSVGVLTAVTADEFARTFNQASAVFDRTKIEPAAGWGVARLQQEFGPSASTVGVMMTGLRRGVSPQHPLARQMTRQAYAGGADWNLRFQGGKYIVRGNLGFSFIEGDSLSIVREQRSSARYFQRPDAGYVALDSSRTSLAGYMGFVNVEKRSGRHWLWSVGTSALSPGFAINDVGLLFSTDVINLFGDLQYRENQRGRLFHAYSFSAFANTGWNYGGVRRQGFLSLNANLTWKNFWRTRLHSHLETRGLSADLTRGGPLMGTGTFWDVSATVSSNPAEKVEGNASAFYGRGETGQRTYRFNTGLTVRPAERWQVSINPSYSYQISPRQYVTVLAGGRAATFGQRYVFSFIERSTLSAQLRLNYIVSPALSLELYTEPFASSGRFYNFGELGAARSRDLHFYGANGTSLTRGEGGAYEVVDGAEAFTFSRPDFNVLSFRSNAVLRWEWRPGSTLFLVWQQNRSASRTDGALIGPGDLFDTLSATGDNFFALKVTYWLPVK